MESLFSKIQPHLSALIEGAHFEGRDYFSILVAENGDIYEKMYKQASSNRFNAFDKLEVIDSHIKPLSKRLLAKM